MDVNTTARVIYLALADYEAIPEAERPTRRAFAQMGQGQHYMRSRTRLCPHFQGG
ncbi:hypothetical protein GS636_21515 [Ruegeria sp. HKCCD4884]|uniref:hypothetical protein n=1 Tax=Ruegeria sp. HKCCD4884 TaxID=2683022 RepID=UPI001490A3EF|nr:hypothetical protein [Ruegeria sp. HKCCD4884]NOD95385.1 hypothetical protein [Ruegeria sp. HKCCD4884]